MTITPEETPMNPITDAQLDEIDARAAHLYEYATGLDDAWQDEADRLTGTDVPALLAEVRRLRARVAAYGTPVTSYPPLPKPDPAYSQIEQRRAELETGFTRYEWAVGMVLCPARNKCTAHRLDNVFKPLKNGRLPMHRDQFGTPCAGAHKKPTTPPLQLRAAPVSA